MADVFEALRTGSMADVFLCVFSVCFCNESPVDCIAHVSVADFFDCVFM